MKNIIALIYLTLFSLACSNRPADHGKGSKGQIVDDGFQTKNNRSSPSSASAIETENELTTLDNYLRQVPGVQVTGAGYNATVSIRGVKTFSGTNSPLFVVDGVPINGTLGEMNNQVEVRDIERVSVLKAGSATALYGLRGTNGVIVISTKKE